MKKIFIIIISISIISLSGCALFKKTEKSETTTNPITKRLPSPENKPSQEFIEFKNCLSLQFNRSINKRYKNEKIEFEKFKSNCLPCYNSYFKSMKTDKAYTPNEFNDAIKFGYDRQEVFINALLKIKKEFESNDIMFEIQNFGKLFKDPNWKTGVESGCNIMTEKGAYLYIVPIMPTITNKYASKEESPAAKIISLTKDYIIFMNEDQFAGNKFQKACEKMFPIPVEDQMMFLGSSKSFKYGDEYILQESSMPQNRSQIFQMLVETNVYAIIDCNTSTNNGTIFYQDAGNYPKLLSEFINR